MKKVVLLLVLFSGFTIFLLVKSCSIKNPKPQNCETIRTTILKIAEGSSYDIVLYDAYGDSYYINRGLEQGLNLAHLNTAVLNKTVTLHLPKLLFGTTSHIAQIAIGDEIIFTEFD